MLSKVWRFVVTFAVVGQFSLGFSLPTSEHTNGVTQYQEHDRLGAVASESAVCSRIGVNLIKAGGNAADAVCSIITGPILRISPNIADLD